MNHPIDCNCYEEADCVIALNKELDSMRSRLQKREDHCSKNCMGFSVEGTASWVRLERLEAAEAKLLAAELLVERMRKALEPFAKACDNPNWARALTIHHCRMAQEALAPSDDSKEAGLILAVVEAAKEEIDARRIMNDTSSRVTGSSDMRLMKIRRWQRAVELLDKSIDSLKTEAR